METINGRAARTESLFREVNERIAASMRRFGADAAQFVCECANPECTEPVRAALDDYDRVRSDGAQFLLANDHEDERFEHVVRERREFEVIEKEGQVGAIARQLDPRPSTT